jgi:hypothetical protein
MKKILSIASDNPHGVAGLRHDEYCPAVNDPIESGRAGGNKIDTVVTPGMAEPSFSFSYRTFKIVVSDTDSSFCPSSDSINRNL